MRQIWEEEERKKIRDLQVDREKAQIYEWELVKMRKNYLEYLMAWTMDRKKKERMF